MRYVRPDENWMRSASSITATSAQTGYAATKVANQDPAWPWWASSGSATLTIDLGTSRSVGIIALIHNNGDDLRTITIGGDISTTIAASTQVNGYPRNVAYIPASPVTAQNLTIAIASNSLDWAIGEVVIGSLRSLPSSFKIGAEVETSRQVIRDVDDQYRHEFRSDLGAELWRMSGRLQLSDSDLSDLLDWWQSTRGGVLPTLVLPDDLTGDPRFCRLGVSLTQTRHGEAPDLTAVDVELLEQARGILVV